MDSVLCGFGGWKSKIEVRAELVSAETTLSLQVAAFLLCLPVVIPLCVGWPPSVYSPDKAASPAGLESILMTSL